MRFKRLVSGIAALTVAMGTFATMTITASAKIVNNNTPKYALRILNGSIEVELSDTYKKPTTLSEFKGEEDIAEWTFNKGNKVDEKYLKSREGDVYIVDSVDKKTSLTNEEMDAIDPEGSPHESNVVVNNVEMNRPSSGDYTLSGEVYYWYNVHVHKANTYKVGVYKTVGSKDAALDTNFTDNTTGFSQGEYTYTEGETDSHNKGDLAFSRFEKGEDGNVYELQHLSFLPEVAGLTSKDSSKFVAEFDPEEFSKNPGNGRINLIYGGYSPSGGLPSGVTLKEVLDEGTEPNVQASKGTVYGSSATVTDLYAGQEYTFYVCHNGTDVTVGSISVSPAYLPADTESKHWKDEKKTLVADKNGTVTLTSNDGVIDTIVIYEKAADKITFKASSTGIDNAFSKVDKTFTKNHAEEGKKIEYSYPLYKDNAGQLYKLASVLNNGMPVAEDMNTFTKSLNQTALNQLNENQNYVYHYSAHTPANVEGEFKQVIEANNEETIDATASMGKAAPNGHTISEIQPGKHTYVVRFKGSALTVSGDDDEKGTIPGETTSWTETNITVTVPFDETGELSLSGAAVDTIIEYSADVETTVEFKRTAQSLFNEQGAKDDPCMAYTYKTTVNEGTKPLDFNIAVQFTRLGDKIGDSGTLSTTITGSADLVFGVIAPVGVDVEPYIKVD